MRIKDILKNSNFEKYKKLKAMATQKNKIGKLSEKDLKELMSHSSYRRGKNGAIKQVR